MYTKGSATHHREALLSSRNAKALAKQEQQQTHQAFTELCQRSHASLQTALAATGLGLWDWNLVTDKTYYDPQWKQILGYEVEEIENHHKSFERLVHPEDFSRVMAVLEDYLEGRIPVYEVEFRMLAKSGEWKWIFDRGRVLQWDRSGQPVQMVGTHQDITAQKHQEQALQQMRKRESLLNTIRKCIYSRSQLQSILETIANVVQQFLQTDRTVIYRFPNDENNMMAVESVKEQNQYIYTDKRQTKASLVFPISLKLEDYQNTISLIPNSHLQVVNQENELLGCSWPSNSWGLLMVYDSSSNRHWQEWEVETLRQVSVEIAIAIQQSQLIEQVHQEIASRVIVEAQEQKIAQQLEDTQQDLRNCREKLVQNEKMANLGKLVVDVAGEIYNSINLISASLHPVTEYAEELIQLLEIYQQSHPKSKTEFASQLQCFDLNFVKRDSLKLLWSIRSNSERIKEIASALWSFSRLEDEQMVKVDIHAGLDCVLRILQHRLKERPDRPRIQIIKEFGELPLVNCYASELNQVFMNILSNAIDALEERIQQDSSFLPKIWIRTEVINCHLSLVGNHNSQPSKQRKIVIRISDNGKGMLPHLKKHIFEPFFTTKLEGKARGMGLSISKQIVVDKHKGKLRCNSQLGQGTELAIELRHKTSTYADIIRSTSF
ncbi:PAS domain-containing protein [Scytonema sp. UIC 10036]|uniref:PAS domain-containing protein n=1 Tax=Scytonema sp. UIC 10036 TaxID=2304196 RepID=UPI0012DA0BEE|nr:PAS domain-containing protein [Scytonema sp. UIC 10036]MUG98141.1 PAS domain-containing protein [Scytonema sp. UIC 10036]